jgi:hypothetical protein
MAKRAETVAEFPELIDAPDYATWERFLLAALKGVFFFGLVSSLALVGTAAAQGLGLLSFLILN